MQPTLVEPLIQLSDQKRIEELLQRVLSARDHEDVDVLKEPTMSCA